MRRSPERGNSVILNSAMGPSLPNCASIGKRLNSVLCFILGHFHHLPPVKSDTREALPTGPLTQKPRLNSRLLPTSACQPRRLWKIRRQRRVSERNTPYLLVFLSLAPASETRQEAFKAPRERTRPENLPLNTPRHWLHSPHRGDCFSPMDNPLNERNSVIFSWNALAYSTSL